MEFNRFMQYAKYDLTINKAFYRNMSIVAVSIITGIAILGFLVRWTMIKMEILYFDIVEKQGDTKDFEDAHHELQSP